MPDPTRTDLHPVSELVTNFTLAALQKKEDFTLGFGPFEEVTKKQGKYHTYTTGDWNRAEMQPRGPSEESAGSGWKISTDTFDIKEFGVHKDNPWDDEDEAPEAIDLPQDALDWLANQASIKGDILFQALFTDAIWTTDYDGVTGTPSASEVKRWSAAASDPQADIEVLKAAVRALISLMPNTIFAGEDVHTTLITHSVFRDAVKYTDRTDSAEMNAGIARWFGVENYVVCRGQYNSAAEGATAVMEPLLDADDLLLCYLNPTPGRKVMTAFKSFVWSGRGGGTQGVVGRTIEMPWKKVTRYEIDYNIDVKLVAADAGAFVKTLV